MSVEQTVPFARRFRLAPLAMLLLACGASASAQTASAAHGPLFGGDASSPPSGALHLTMSLTHGRDDDLSADGGTGTSPLQPHVAGPYDDLDGALFYSAKNRRVSVTARANGTARRTPVVNQLADSNSAGLAEVTVELTRRTFLRTSVNASHISSFAFDTLAQQIEAPVAADAAAPATGNPLTGLDWIRTTYGGSTALTRTFGRASSVTLVAGVGYSERPSLAQRGQEQALTLLFSRHVGRDGALRLSYTYSDGLQTAPDQQTKLLMQDVQLTVEQTWRHSKFRRTVVMLGAGPSLLEQRQRLSVTLQPEPILAPDGSGNIVVPSVIPEPTVVEVAQNERLYRAVGTLLISHDVTSTWNAQAWYRRGTGVQDAMFFSNAGGLNIRGRFGRRISVDLSGGYNDGDLNLGTLQNRFGTSNATARLQVALARSLALQGQYFYYHYKYKSGPDLPEGLFPQMNRRGLRVGLVFWAPLKRGRA